MERFGAAVFVQTADGSARMVSPPGDGLYYQASVHPDGHEVVFFGAHTGPPRIWRVVLDSGQPVCITPEASGARHPVYDWSGERIAFASDRRSPVPGETVDRISSATINVDPGMRLHLYTANPDGSDVRQITHGPYQDHRPSFSPDGEWIAFASNRSGETAIWRVPADGSREPEPVFLGHWGYRPWYTPDGTSVLFYGPDGARHRIWVADVATGATTPLASDDTGTTHGPFIPPGEDDLVLVHSSRGGEMGIWELPLHGSWMPRCITPAAFPIAAHPTRSRNHVMSFDVKNRHLGAT